MIFNEVLRRWFGLDPRHCESCEILRTQLDESSRERKDLLMRLLDRDKPESPSIVSTDDMVPIKPQFTPWRVRQQMLEAEDREKARLMKEKVKEIDELEKEVGIGSK